MREICNLTGIMRVFAGAGEPSGDRILSGMLAGLRAHFPALEIRGFGGPLSESRGLVPVVPFQTLSVNGLRDTLRRIFSLAPAYFKLRRALERFQPDLVLLVDYPGMNERLGAAALMLGFKTYYIAPPQLWVYRDPASRLRRLRRRLPGASLQVLFPLELEFYSAWAPRVAQGHFFVPPSSAAPPSGGHLLLCPGSRAGVMNRNLPLWLERIARIWPDMDLDILVPEALAAEAKLRLKPHPRARLVHDSESAFANARAAIAFPGTMSLELFLHRIPTRVWAILDLPTLWVGKRKLAKRWTGLPNLLLGRMQVPEWVGTRRQFTRIPPALPPLAEWDPVSESDVAAVWTKMGPATGVETGVKASLELLQELRELDSPAAKR